MQFRMDGLGGTARGELAVFSGTPNGEQVWLPLGFIPELGTDYYLGFVHDDEANTLTFHVQDLSAVGPLSSTTFDFEGYGFADATDVEIGNVSGGACGADSHAHDGLIDEVRISDGTLARSELLVADFVFADGFEALSLSLQGASEVVSHCLETTGQCLALDDGFCCGLD